MIWARRWLVAVIVVVLVVVAAVFCDVGCWYAQHEKRITDEISVP